MKKLIKTLQLSAEGIRGSKEFLVNMAIEKKPVVILFFLIKEYQPGLKDSVQQNLTEEKFKLCCLLRSADTNMAAFIRNIDFFVLHMDMGSSSISHMIFLITLAFYTF